MGEAELNKQQQQIIIHSTLFFYGDASSQDLSNQIAEDIANHWNEGNGEAIIRGYSYRVVFDIVGIWVPILMPQEVYENTNPRNNYFRIESFAGTDISFVDGIGSNTGYFKLDNLLNNSTTAAHEYGHTIGLEHPRILDICGKGTPGIMYPRGTIVDPIFQYSPVAKPLEPGGTINPFTRKVLQEDIKNLHLEKLAFDKNGFAQLGEFTSQWHEKHLQ
ncbi:MAG: peptidase M10 [Ferruginibacter sp.]